MNDLLICRLLLFIAEQTVLLTTGSKPTSRDAARLVEQLEELARQVREEGYLR